FYVIIPLSLIFSYILFFSNATPPPAIYTLSLHDALPIFGPAPPAAERRRPARALLAHQHAVPEIVVEPERAEDADVGVRLDQVRSEEHTSELQSPCNLVCRLLLEKKKKNKN